MSVIEWWGVSDLIFFIWNMLLTSCSTMVIDIQFGCPLPGTTFQLCRHLFLVSVHFRRPGLPLASYDLVLGVSLLKLYKL